jgi:hypothetical protein
VRAWFGPWSWGEGEEPSGLFARDKSAPHMDGEGAVAEAGGGGDGDGDAAAWRRLLAAERGVGDLRQRLEDCTLLVGLHPDGATGARSYDGRSPRLKVGST